LAGKEDGVANGITRLRQAEVDALGAVLAQHPDAMRPAGAPLSAEAEAGAAEAAFWLSWSAASLYGRLS
jgi:hypothetical protein